MKCPSCGNKIEAGQKFCMKCGFNLENLPARTLPAGGRKKINAAVLGIAFLAILAAALIIWLLSGGVFGSSANQVVYGVRKDSNVRYYEAVNRVDMNGKNIEEIYEDAPGTISSSQWLSYFSQDGRLLQFYDDTEEELVILNTKDGSRTTYQPLGEQVLYSTLVMDDEYILMLEVDSGDLVMTYLDTKGNRINTFDNIVPVSGEPHGNQSIVIKFDGEDGLMTMDEIGRVDVRSGDYTSIFSLDGEETGSIISSRDDKAIVFQEGDDLIFLDVSSGDHKTIFTGDTDSSMDISISGDGRMVAVVDNDDKRTLYTIKAKDETQTKIDRYAASVIFTPDNSHILYTTEEGSGSYDLFIVKVDGSGKTRLAKDIGFEQFALSPNGKWVAYIDEQDGASELMVVDLTGRDPLRLDKEVRSFRFTEDGRSIVYAKVEDYYDTRPESEIFLINVNGKGQKLIVEKDDGIFEILFPAVVHW